MKSQWLSYYSSLPTLGSLLPCAVDELPNITPITNNYSPIGPKGVTRCLGKRVK